MITIYYSGWFSVTSVSAARWNSQILRIYLAQVPRVQSPSSAAVFPWDRAALTTRVEASNSTFKGTVSTKGKIVCGSELGHIKKRKETLSLLTAYPNCVRISSNAKGKDTWMAGSWEPRMRGKTTSIAVIVTVSGWVRGQCYFYRKLPDPVHWKCGLHHQHQTTHRTRDG